MHANVISQFINMLGAQVIKRYLTTFMRMRSRVCTWVY